MVRNFFENKTKKYSCYSFVYQQSLKSIAQKLAKFSLFYSLKPKATEYSYTTIDLLISLITLLFPNLFLILASC